MTAPPVTPEPAFVAMGNHNLTKLAARTFLSDGRILGSVDFAPGGICAICHTPAQARDIAQAFTELAGLMQARQAERDAAGTP